MRRWRRWPALAAVVLALLVIGVGAAGGGFTVGDPPPVTGAERTPPPPEDDEAAATAPPAGERREPPEAWELPAWMDTAFNAFGLALVIAFALALVALVAHRLVTGPLHRRPIEGRASQPDGQRAEPEEVRDALRAGLADLDAGGDPRRAVIACWLRLERVAAAAGTPRLVADTPQDLVTRLLAAHRVDDEALRALADAYRRARYAPVEVAADLRATAREALSRVVAALPTVDREDA